jgi:MoaA/NifB/PqqE/SkfB family radical SAM enzyme
MARGLGEARAAAARLGVPLVWDLPAPYSNLNPLALELETPPQGAGRAFLYVEPDGDVLPGQGIDHVLGNLLRDDWASIWAATKQPA